MKLAINQTFKNKASASEFKQATKTYENISCSLDQLAEFINLGTSFCSQHSGNWRKSANYLPSNILAVDIDQGLTIDDAMASPFVQNHAAILYTTVNHSDEFHRFRIVFETEQLIEKSTDMKSALSGLVFKFGGDRACTDACRTFFGSENSNPTILGNKISNDVLKTLIKQGDEFSSSTNRISQSSGRQISTTRSTTRIDDFSLITDSLGHDWTLSDIPVRTSVHCPIHIDNKASAFVIISKQGTKGVYCSTCRFTYFSSSSFPLFNFDYGWDKIELKPAIDDEMSLLTSIEDQPLERFNSQYLPSELNSDASVLIIKSPKGSGKTEFLRSIVQRAGKNQSILLIGHRRSLIASIAARLGLQSYLNQSTSYKGSTTATNPPTNRYAISIDSLSTLLNPSVHRYDIVIIDESEQVFTHLTSDTLKKEKLRINSYKYLKHYLTKAKQTITLDADLNRLTALSLVGFNDHHSSKDFKIYLNDYKPSHSEINIYEKENQLLSDLNQAIENGDKCYVCSNSKKSVIKQKDHFQDLFPDKKFLCITADNSQDPEIQSFITNIKTEILQYDAIFASPSLSTGVDITFPDDETLIDKVFGIFQSRTNTHFEIDQQISRVRHPKEINVWISPKTFRFETNEDIIRNEIKSSQKNSKEITEIKDDGTIIYDSFDTGYLDLYVTVTSIERGSKNHLKKHFINLKEFNGWTVNTIELDDEKIELGKKIKRELNHKSKQKNIENLLSALLLTTNDFTALTKAGKTLSLLEPHTHSLRRYEIESFYLTAITHELIEQDKNGKRREHIRNYEHFIQVDAGNDSFHKKGTHITDQQGIKDQIVFLREVYSLAKLLDESGNLRTDKLIHQDDLTPCMTYISKNNVKIQRLFDFAVRKDIAKNPVQQLGDFIKFTGIKWVKITKYKTGGGKKYFYKITQESIDELNEIVARRRIIQPSIHPVKGTKHTPLYDWNQERQSTKENRLFSGRYSNHLKEIKFQISNPDSITTTSFKQNYIDFGDN